MVGDGCDHAVVSHVGVMIERIAQPLPHRVRIGNAAFRAFRRNNAVVKLLRRDEHRRVINAAEAQRVDTLFLRFAEIGWKTADACQLEAAVVTERCAENAPVDRRTENLGIEPAAACSRQPRNEQKDSSINERHQQEEREVRRHAEAKFAAGNLVDDRLQEIPAVEQEHTPAVTTTPASAANAVSARTAASVFT